MQHPSDTRKSAAPTLHTETRYHPKSDTAAHIKGVNATSGGLIRATIGAAAAAGVILVLFWLPAEYGIDPTGVGGILGLVEMGEIKQQLYDEAAADDAAAAAPIQAPPVSALDERRILERLDGIEAQLAVISTALDASQATAQIPDQAPAQATIPAETEVVAVPVPGAVAWRDEVSYTLAPDEGVEVKLVMEEGAAAEFEWTANGAVLNFDTHGDGGGQNISYEKGRGVAEQQGTLTAVFSGNHGWFWRNRTDANVTLSLRTRGAYAEMRMP